MSRLEHSAAKPLTRPNARDSCTAPRVAHPPLLPLSSSLTGGSHALGLFSQCSTGGAYTSTSKSHVKVDSHCVIVCVCVCVCDRVCVCVYTPGVLRCHAPSGDLRVSQVQTVDCALCSANSTRQIHMLVSARAHTHTHMYAIAIARHIPPAHTSTHTHTHTHTHFCAQTDLSSEIILSDCVRACVCVTRMFDVCVCHCAVLSQSCSQPSSCCDTCTLSFVCMCMCVCVCHIQCYRRAVHHPAVRSQRPPGHAAPLRPAGPPHTRARRQHRGGHCRSAYADNRHA